MFNWNQLSKSSVGAAFIFALCGALFVSLASANPYHPSYVFKGTKSPDAFTKPPTVLIISPENNTVYSTNQLAFAINVSVGKSSTASSRFLWDIYYTADWLPSRIYIYELHPNASSDETSTSAEVITEFSATINLTSMPEGTHNVTAYARERGAYEENSGETVAGTINPIIYTYNFDIYGSSSVDFTVDTTPPSVSVISPENTTYDTANVTLNFTVNEYTSQVSYVLDSGENIAVEGNTTLAGLSNGEHNVTVYATDIAGNVGSSETITFTVAKPEPFPTTPVVASAVAVAAISAGILVYLKKRRR